MASDSIFKHDSAVGQERTSYLTKTCFYHYIISSFNGFISISSMFFLSAPPLSFPLSPPGSPTVALPGRAAGCTSDTCEDKRETPDCRGEGSHPWQCSAGFRLFMVGTNYRLSDPPSSRLGIKKTENWFRQKNTD